MKIIVTLQLLKDFDYNYNDIIQMKQQNRGTVVFNHSGLIFRQPER